MKNHVLFAIALTLAAPMLAAALGPGGPGGMGGAGSAAGPGMLTVAGDGSLLVTEMTAGMMGGGGSGQMGDRELINITPDGQIRWRVSFEEGWPMRPVNDGDLVVFALGEDSWMGGGMGGDGSPPGGGQGGGGGGGGGGMPGAASVTLVGLDLATGGERWRTEIDGDMASLPQFAPDGSRLYLTVRDMGTGSQMPGAPMHQGDAPSGAMMMSTSVVAVGRNGVVQWVLDLSDDRP